MSTWLNKSDVTVRKPHLVIVSYYFPPMGGGGVQRIVKSLKFLDRSFWQVTVVTVKPSFFYSWDETLMEDLPSGLTVIRTGSLDPFRLGFLLRQMLGRSSGSGSRKSRESSGLVRRLANWWLVPDSRLFWLPFLVYRLRKLHREQGIDLLICTVPPFTAGLAGALLAREPGIRLVLDMRDAWTNNPYLPELTPFHRRLQHWLEAWCLAQARGVVFVNDELARHYRETKPCLQGKPSVVVRNGFDPDDFADLPAPDARPPLKIGVMGTIYSQGNRPLTFLKAVRKLREQRPELARHLRIVFLGKWSPDFLQALETHPIQDMISLEPYCPHRQALRAMARCHALALAIEDHHTGSRCVTPGRIYEYLYLKRPVLAMCPPEGDLARLVKKHHAGTVVPYSNVEHIMRVLEQWISRPELLSRFCFKHIDVYHRRIQTQRLEAFLKGVL